MDTLGPTLGSRGSLGAVSPQSSVTRVLRGTTDCRSLTGSTQERLFDRRAPIGWLLRRGRCHMRIEYERCCGLDVHKKTVVVCLLVPDAKGGRQKQTRTFSTMTAEILALADWLAQGGARM